MADVVNFFAYGELINEDYFKEKGLEYISKSSVTLSAWRRVFNKIPIDNGGVEGLGLVNIEPTPDNAGMMHGELYVMDEKFVPKLDEIFGHPDEYQRKVMRFNRRDFILVNGLTYIARPDKIATGLKPSKATMKIFRKAKKLFPMLYFSRLMNTRTCD
ncbi:MAG: gamma-glutamylcyclotransferase [Nitrospinaceae bacterium]|nr:gamma-glutamylcyclotransferase [Nitrospinaceae bacterium]